MAFFKYLLGFLFFILLGLIFVSEASAALININTASSEELQTLDGIGPTYAQRIIDYRNGPQGPFDTIEEIKEVQGIGDTTFNKIRDSITVGEANAGTNSGVNQGTNTETGSPTDPPSSSAVEVKVLKLSISADPAGVVGQPLEFRAETSSDKLAVTWVFGDGSVGYGSVVEHIYEYPGEYVVMASISNSGRKLSSRTTIKIADDTLSIVAADSKRVEVLNKGNTEVNLHGRSLAAEGRVFNFPEGTIIKAGQKISFPSRITGLTTPAGVTLVLSSEIADKSPVVEYSTMYRTSTIYRTSEDLEDKQRRIAQIYEQILDLQIKQQELKKQESVAISESQVASAVIAVEKISTSTKNEQKVSSWLGTIKRFFGFK